MIAEVLRGSHPKGHQELLCPEMPAANPISHAPETHCGPQEEERGRLLAVFSMGSFVTWIGRELPVRRRRGTGDTESSKINGLAETKIYDTYASSSGYSSEDDYAGRWTTLPWRCLVAPAALVGEETS